MEIVLQKFQYWQHRLRTAQFPTFFDFFLRHPQLLLAEIKMIGVVQGMDDYEKRKLKIFNQLNFLQLLFGILVPFSGMWHSDGLPVSAWLISCLPVLTSVVVLVLNFYKRHEWARLSYFIVYPFLTCIVYLNGVNAGITLHFILFGILSVFFLQDVGYMIFTVALSMMSYFILAVVLEKFIYEVKFENPTLYLFNQALALGFIFYGLYLVKRENASYQFRILRKNTVLHKKNTEIKKQSTLLAEKAKLLRVQKQELVELNSLKNKLFSVIAHDLKSPVYAVRGLFQNMHQQNMPAADIRKMLPDVLSELNYTIGLMDNLLHWSKSQMQSSEAKVEEVDISVLINDVMRLLSLQAEAKQVYIENKASLPIRVYADKDMINLVLRNLLSNAIKFTPHNGIISVGVNNLNSHAEVFVQDTGTGISAEALQKIKENNFYTTKGTASEGGTGLGLMLCKEFLKKNGGQMFIESELGKGSIFSFTLPTGKR